MKEGADVKLDLYSQATGKKLRKGYTTGTCAAAAARGAALYLRGLGPVHQVKLKTPAGPLLSLPLLLRETTSDSVLCGVIKDAGDDPDVTHGLEIQARVKWNSRLGVEIKGGPGVGTVTLAGLAQEVGEAAINGGPRKQIVDALSDLLPEGAGFTVTICVPGGEKVAEKTMNQALGVQGGISILGTTGIVEPMSMERLQESLLPQLDMALAKGHRSIVLVPGRIGLKAAGKILGQNGIPVALMSNHVGFMLEACREKGFKEVTLMGHFGKLVKVAGGIFNTHSKVADGRLEIIAAHAALLRASPEQVKDILQVVTAEAVLGVLPAKLQEKLWYHLAEVAASKARDYSKNSLDIRVIFLTLKGKALAVYPPGL